MRHLLSLLYLATCITTFAQADNEKKLSKKELIEQADYYFFKENFDRAIVLYDSILHNYPRNHYVIYHQYVAHHLTHGRGTDLSGLKEFEKNEGHTDKFYNYWLGRIHHERYEFELAQKHFQAFLNLEIYRTREIIKEAENRLADSKRAQSFYLDANEYEVELMSYPINSDYADLSPAFFANHDELLFVSARPDLNDETTLDNPSYRIFHTTKTDRSNWNPANPLNELGSLKPENAKIEVVNNDGRLYIYRENDGQGDLYFSEPKGSQWSEFEEFNSDLRNRKIESHFFINDSESVVYFTSTSPDGDLDIYQSKQIQGTNIWTDPIPVFGQLNSAFNEDGPFLSHDEKSLYFSSNRPESIGGYDIFRSDWNEDTQSWGEPVNLGFPINTIDDEINFQLNEDNISGFFSSNRIFGKGDFDIYHFHKQGKVLVQGKVYDEATGEELTGIQLDFKPTKNLNETFQTKSNEYGEFSKEILQDEEFVVELSVAGQILKTEQITSRHDELKKSFTKNFEVTVPEQLSKETDFLALYDDKGNESKYEQVGMLGSKFRKGTKARLRNIYFDSHSAHLTANSDAVLEVLLATMNDNKSLVIEVEGHTDNTGTVQQNQVLSEKRAQSVKAFLTNQGISSNRIKTIGYGDSKPLASNDDEKDGRELNRRIEINVVE